MKGEPGKDWQEMTYPTAKAEAFDFGSRARCP